MKPAATHHAAERSFGLMKIGVLSAAFVLAVQILLVTAAQAQSAGIPGPSYAEPLGIGLEGWPYPYPVQFMPLEVGGQRLRMQGNRISKERQ
jgi:hypothetical protein